MVTSRSPTTAWSVGQCSRSRRSRAVSAAGLCSNHTVVIVVGPWSRRGCSSSRGPEHLHARDGCLTVFDGAENVFPAVFADGGECVPRLLSQLTPEGVGQRMRQVIA